MKTIRAKLRTVLAVLFASPVTVGGVGWQAARIANDGLNTVFVDCVRLHRFLKTLSALHAFDIAGAAKARDNNVGWSVCHDPVSRMQTTLATA
ncbi:MAG: hypothetical protein IT539_16365 [Bradyrhizobiaceae bacterium]|nr:hypothetical protein [Bradyrhizobiaceae bacterium]